MLHLIANHPLSSREYSGDRRFCSYVFLHNDPNPCTHSDLGAIELWWLNLIPRCRRLPAHAQRQLAERHPAVEDDPKQAGVYLEDQAVTPQAWATDHDEA